MSSFFGGNNQQSSGFGGFGSNNNTGTGFGQTSNTGFGASSAPNTGGGLFGTANNNNNSGFGGFGATGSTAGPFGANNTSGFGATTSSGGGMFGGNTATSGAGTGFGGFGGSNANTGGGLFGGGNKPAFGSQPAASGSLFGGTSTFGSSNNQSTTSFGGAPLSSALGSNNTECQGTGSTAFSAYAEKETPSGNQTNHFQSITFIHPYKNFSFEELRLADYNQGRRFGNGSGQAGAFGTSTGFGGFGGQNTASGFGSNNQGTGLFGAQTSSAAPFGGAQTATSGFGANNTGGGLFGSATSKPGGIFGSTASQPTTGGLFGNSNQSGGFGAQSTTGTGFGNTQSGGGLFGGANNQQKPGFSFGQNSNTGTGFGASSNSGFGTNNTTNTGGGLFGSNPTNTAFGSGQQQPASNPFGGFGNNQQNQNQNQGNTGSGFGAFGTNDQQKPGGLFGSNNTTNNTGGLFGNANQNNQQPAATGGGLFGNTSNNQAGGTSLFGAKPATGGTGLFGNNNTSNTGSTGGIFGNNANNQSQQNQTGGLFGNTNNQQQQKTGGLFGSSTGTGLFGSNNNQQQGTNQSLFGGIGSSNQQQQSGGLFGNTNNNSSLFGNSQQPQQSQANNPLQAPQAYSASIFDANPYGSRSIFDGLPPPPQQYTGPVATPIGQKEKVKKGAVLPQYRINPHVASRFVTPQKRQGYGFTYSTYGTPSSASSNMSTPGGMSSSLLAGSISRGLGKSLSTSNLRRSFDPDQESLLSPGAFSAGSTRHSGTGSLKKLTIDRSLRTDLFQSPPALPSSERNDQSRQPSILKKKVSFDASTVGGNGDMQNGAQLNGVNGLNEERRISSNSHTSDHEPPVSSQPNGLVSGPQSEGSTAQPEMEQVRGNELAVINEDGNQDSQSAENFSKAPKIPERDPEPGAYFMKPSQDEIKSMSSEQRSHVSGFCIGRENCGYVIFDQPVNLNKVSLDRIFADIAQIKLRSVTLYPEAHDKPPKGKGLNVPSTIYLANSWPRNRFEKNGRSLAKHVQRLQRVQGTEFVKYERDTGTWVFKVEHFSTYALDYDDEGSEGDTFRSSTLSAPPESPTPRSRLPRAGSTPMPPVSMQDSSFLSSEFSAESSGPDDTFEFRKKKLLPGAFDDGAISDEENEHMMDMAEVNDDNQSFLDQPMAGSVSGAREPVEFTGLNRRNGGHDFSVGGEQLDMAGSFPQVDGGSEQADSSARSPLQAAQQMYGFGTPGKLQFNDDGDWAEELRRTISPRKQDRQALRESQARVMQHKEDNTEMTPKASIRQHTAQPAFATTMDLMNSIFPKEQGRRTKGRGERAGQGKAFQYPYPKTLTANGEDGRTMHDNDRQWHNSFKPSWGPTSTLVDAVPRNPRSQKHYVTKTDRVFQDLKTVLVSEGRDIHFAKPTPTSLLTPNSLSLQKTHTRISVDQGVPHASPQQIPLKDIALSVNPGALDERNAWQLASILFDKIHSTAFGNIPTQDHAKYEHRIRKDQLSTFWSTVCSRDAQKAITKASSAEERAIGYLSTNALVKACEVLVEAKDFRLATLVSQLPADQIMAEDMASQIHEWRELCVLSELTEPIRALYDICAGNVCICEGKKGAIEDQAKTFVLSQRFGLDWRRAFGLRLWYATRAEAPIEEAVKLFYTELQSDETVKPTPTFVHSSCSEWLAWPDDKSALREDIHWRLLKLFASSKNAVPVQSIADMVMPHELEGHPLDFRLSFQLYHALAHLFPANTDPAKADQLAWDFAIQLEAQGEWLWSVFILLHLSEPAQRQKSLLDILARNAGSIPAPDTAFPFSTLVSDFKIPARWIWEAKALYARSVLQDHAEEIYDLQQAGNWTEAHATLCRVVGPRCVIEQDTDTLDRLIEGFERGKKSIEEAWRKGGEIYEGYVDLAAAREKRCDAETVEKLLHALLELMEEKRGDFGFEEGIAIREIAGMVADEVARGGYEELDLERVLKLPLTGEQYRRHSVDIKLKRFENVMKGARNRQLRSP